MLNSNHKWPWVELVCTAHLAKNFNVSREDDEARWWGVVDDAHVPSLYQLMRPGLNWEWWPSSEADAVEQAAEARTPVSGGGSAMAPP